MIKTRNLHYDYIRTTEKDGVSVEKKLSALKGIDVEIEKGEFVAVLGRNGSGKSTFSKHLNALLMPTEGCVYIKGFDTKEEQFVWEIRKSCGMVFQNPDNQIIASVVEEDVAFGPENLGVQPSVIGERVRESLEAVQMLDFIKNSPSRLSGGQKQRIAIAGILAMKPDCIVLDEPTAMLDPGGRKEVIDTVLRLNREEGITIVLITHFMEEAAEADRVIVMDDGAVVSDGSPREIFAEVETLKRIGLDVPSMTEIAYNLRKKGIGVPCDILTIDEMVGAICQLKSIT